MPRLGFHPCIWKCGTDLVRFWEAVGDMAAAGWDGFEVAGSVLEPYYERPDEFARLLVKHGMELATVYSSHSFADPLAIGAELERVRRIARFCQAVGCEVLLIDGGQKPVGREHAEEDYQRVAQAANRMGKIAREHGLTCAWHQHWGTMFEFAPAFHHLMAFTDPDLVKFCPDTAHLTLGGFDLPQVFSRYLDRIAYVHFKDLDADKRFIELGRGTIDFAPLWALLKSRHYDGWIVVDLDYTDLEVRKSCQANREYLQRLGIPGRRG